MIKMNAMKTILFFVPGADGGGVASAFKTLAKELEACGWNIKVLLPYEADIKRCAIPMHYVIGYAKKRNERNPWKIRISRLFHCLTSYKFYFWNVPNIEHDIFVVYQAASFSFWQNYTKKTIFGWFHGEAPNCTKRWTQKIWSIFECQDYRKFTKLFAVGENIAQQWMEYYGNKIIVQSFPNILDINQIQYAIEQKACNILGEYKRCKLLYVGRLSKEKGVVRLLEITQRLIDEGYDFDLFLLGNGELRELLEDFIKQNNLSSYVHLLGWQALPYTYMNEADLLILPSFTEGFGLVLWEALLSGCHTLATTSNGTREALHGGAYGMLCENSTEGLYQGVKKILEDDVGYKQQFNLPKIQQEIIIQIKQTKDLIKHSFRPLG